MSCEDHPTVPIATLHIDKPYIPERKNNVPGYANEFQANGRYYEKIPPFVKNKCNEAGQKLSLIIPELKNAIDKLNALKHRAEEALKHGDDMIDIIQEDALVTADELVNTLKEDFYENQYIYESYACQKYIDRGVDGFNKYV